MVLQLGSLVTYRRRPWILADREGSLLYLRPLGGGDGELLPVHLDLLEALKPVLPYEDLSYASFPPPPSSPLASPQELRLFLQGARLLLRDGTAPLRSQGRVGAVRKRRTKGRVSGSSLGPPLREKPWPPRTPGCGG